MWDINAKMTTTIGEFYIFLLSYNTKDYGDLFFFD